MAGKDGEGAVKGFLSAFENKSSAIASQFWNNFTDNNARVLSRLGLRIGQPRHKIPGGREAFLFNKWRGTLWLELQNRIKEIKRIEGHWKAIEEELIPKLQKMGEASKIKRGDSGDDVTIVGTPSFYEIGPRWDEEECAEEYDILVGGTNAHLYKDPELKAAQDQLIDNKGFVPRSFGWIVHQGNFVNSSFNLEVESAVKMIENVILQSDDIKVLSEDIWDQYDRICKGTNIFISRIKMGYYVINSSGDIKIAAYAPKAK
ncbi:MAG: hypothetical protein ABIH34_05800, partial [Nanoarchaeota archaeon]